MTEVESERASLPARYQELKLALLDQLNRARTSDADQHGLRQALKEWHGVAEDPALPAGVHYLLERHPQTSRIDTVGEENTAILKRLHEIARNEDIEVFTTVLEFGPEGDVKLVHMADGHENDIHEYFAAEKQEVLQNPADILEVRKCAGECVSPTQSRIVST